MSDYTVWRCERASDGDVKFAARLDHKEKLEAKDYVCVVYPDMDWYGPSLYNPDEPDV